jgi:hypothetical protein
VTQVLEAQVRPLVMTIPRFIQLILPLPPLKPMDQSRRGVAQVLEAQPEIPHALIDPSVSLMAAKADLVE